MNDSVKTGRLQDMPKRKPFAHQAAKASWIISLIALGMAMITNSATKSNLLSLWIISGLMILFFFNGIILGLIGLLGAKKHGSKGILVPSIIGVSLNGCFLFLFILAVGSAYKSAHQWQEIKPPGGGFSILMPSNPKEEIKTLKSQSVIFRLHVVHTRRGDSEFMVSYVDYPESYIQANNPDDILDGIQNGCVANLKGSLISEEKLILLSKYPGRELMIDVPAHESITWGRIFLVNNRLYQLAVSFPKQKKKTISPHVEKLFDSFALSNQKS